MRRFGLRVLKWPFSNKDINKCPQVINNYKVTFTLVIASDYLQALYSNNRAFRTNIISTLTRTIKDDIVRLGDSLADIQTEQRAQAIREK